MHARNTLSCPTVFFFQGITLTYPAQKKVVRLTGIPLGCPGPAWNSTPKGKSGCGTLMLCFQGRDDENSIPYLMSQKSSPYAGTFIKPKRKPQNLMELADEQDQRIMHLQKLSSSSSKVGILSSPTSEVLLGERHLTYRLFLPPHISGSSSQAEDFLGRYNQASLPGRRMKASLGACPPK